MSLKWKEISLLISEAEATLRGSVLQKFAQVRDVANDESFSLQGFGARGGWRIWACLLRDHGAWVFAEDEWALDSQAEPSTFVMVVRKYLVGKKIVGVEQVPGERIVLIHFEHGMSLLFELLPKRANLLLVEDWSAEARVARCVQSFRQVSLETGALYRLPPLPPAAGAAAGADVRAFDESHGPFPFHRAVAEKLWTSVQRSGFAGYQRVWRQAWKSHSRKVNTALENARGDLREAQQAELFQKRGMALVSRLYELGAQGVPREKVIEIDGIEIPLDPAKSYSENAETFFRKAKKLHRAVGELDSRVAALEKKNQELAGVAEKIEKAQTDEDLAKLNAAFEAEGLTPPERDPEEGEREKEAKPYLEVESSDGFKILCGRNQEENRRVTFREAKGNDTWLHVKGQPGAHVVVKSQRNKSVPLSTLLEAAQLCLYYSRIRKGKSAEVDYTQRKHVRAIKGTLAEVTYTGNKTLYLDADPELLKRVMRAGGV